MYRNSGILSQCYDPKIVSRGLESVAHILLSACAITGLFLSIISLAGQGIVPIPSGVAIGLIGASIVALAIISVRRAISKKPASKKEFIYNGMIGFIALGAIAVGAAALAHCYQSINFKFDAGLSYAIVLSSCAVLILLALHHIEKRSKTSLSSSQKNSNMNGFGSPKSNVQKRRLETIPEENQGGGFGSVSDKLPALLIVDEIEAARLKRVSPSSPQNDSNVTGFGTPKSDIQKLETIAEEREDADSGFGSVSNTPRILLVEDKEGTERLEDFAKSLLR